MELNDIIEVNELFSPMYAYVARQVLDAYGREEGSALELGPFAGGVSIELARQCPRMRITMGDDFPGLLPYFEKKVQEARLTEQITVSPLDKYNLSFPDDTFDLAVFRGGLFFWDNTLRIMKEMYRVVRHGGLVMIGGGFGANAPDELIETIARQSRDLNRKLGKRVMGEADLQKLLHEAGFETRSVIDCRHGLWSEIRKIDC